jgi:GTP cyclohydrolase IA
MHSQLPDNQQKEFQQLIKQLIALVGEDPNRSGLLRTPQRVSDSYAFLTSGYKMNIADEIGDAIFDSEGDEMVIVKDIEIYSLCEHHLLPFYGLCHIAYLPKDKIIGLSKLSRIVNVFARRFQIQERLTHQIAKSIQDVLEPFGVGVVVQARHLCMMMRGVEKQRADTLTSCMLGTFKSDPKTRTEFLNLIGTNF